MKSVQIIDNDNKKHVRQRELNYLIITPRFSLLPYPQNQDNSGTYLPPVPMGVAYVSASMKTVSKKVYNLNLELEPGEVFDAIAGSIKKNKIDVVLTGGMAGQFTKIKKVVDSVKKINKEIIVVVGGGVMTPIPEAAMKAFECVDIGVIGEGEITAKELVLALNSNNNLGDHLNSIAGLIYKKDGGFEITKPREEISDLDSLPLPDYVGLGCDKIFKSQKVAFVVASRSCPFKCTFCYHPCGTKYRKRSVDNIMSEVEFLVENYGIKTIAFFDELLVSTRGRVEELCTKIKPYNVNWGATVHAATFKSDLLELMRESGCNTMNLGIESASDKVLKSMNKRSNIKQVETALEKIREARIGTMSSIIFGDIAEDTETIEETLKWWRSKLQYSIELSRIYVYPGSYNYSYAVRQGIIRDEVAHLRNDCRDANISKLTERQYSEMLLRLTTEEAFYSYPPERYSILSVDIDAQKTLADYTCGCGHKDEIWTRGLLLSNSFRCPECLQGFRFPYHEQYSFTDIRINIESLIKEKGKIAFWGLGREMQLLLRGINVSSLDGVFIIDRDPKKHGLNFMGKEVFAPNILQKENIGIVVPTPVLEAGIHYLETIEMETAKFSSAEIMPFGEILRQGIMAGIHG